MQVGGREYTFAGGGGVFDMTPQEAAGAKFRESIDMGAFEGSESKLASIIDELKPQVRVHRPPRDRCHPCHSCHLPTATSPTSPPYAPDAALATPTSTTTTTTVQAGLI